MMEEEPVADMVRETYRIVREAMDKGVADNVIPAAMARKLDNSAFLFSGFKTAQELKEASLLLREKDGTVKGFSRFLTDIRRIDANYNVRYLEAEYNFAVSSAQMAASWAEVSQDGDRYDLQYRTAGDDHVREEHRALNGVTLPPSNDFWRYYYPPNGWNCRCTAVQVRKGKYPTSDAGQAMEAGRRTTDTPKKRIFRFNPGIDGQLFPPKHPYYKLSREAAGQVKKAVKALQETAPEQDTDTGVDLVRLRRRRKEIKQEAKTLAGRTFSNRTFDKPISITNTDIKEWLNQPHKHIEAKNELLLEIGEVVQNAEYLGAGPDKHILDVTAHFFEIEIKTEKSWIVVREHPDGECHIHSISDNVSILKHIQKKPPEK